MIERELLMDLRAEIMKIAREEVKKAILDTSQVRRGKWYKPSGMMPPEYAGVYRCSECDGFAMRDWKSHKQVLSDYCPHCGARMEDSDG